MKRIKILTKADEAAIHEQWLAATFINDRETAKELAEILDNCIYISHTDLKGWELIINTGEVK